MDGILDWLFCLIVPAAAFLWVLVASQGRTRPDTRRRSDRDPKKRRDDD